MPSGHIKHHKTSYLYALRRQTDTKNYAQNNKWAYKNEKLAQFICPCIKKTAQMEFASLSQPRLVKTRRLLLADEVF